jgi:acid phosphatase
LNPNRSKLIIVSSVLFFISLLLISTYLYTELNPTVQANRPGKYFDHLVFIIMENEGYCDVVTLCGGVGHFETQLAEQYAIAGNCESDSSCSEGGYSAVAHPSEPNYAALISGGVYTDTQSTCCFQDSHRNLVDLLVSGGLTWQAYDEDATNAGTCNFLPSAYDQFPFLFFADDHAPSRCANFLSTNSSDGDASFIASLNAPRNWANFIWFTPNNSNDGDSTNATFADTYLSHLVPRILNSTMFRESRSALFITYDEGNSVYPHDYLYASWSGPTIKRGYIGSGSYSHYSFLKTLEVNWELAPLTSNDAQASPMTEFFLTNTETTR